VTTAIEKHWGICAINPNRKGKPGDREFAALLRRAGFNARRGRWGNQTW
jgi:hypothetical protein